MIIVLDQFAGPTPYSLRQEPIDWAQFVEDCELAIAEWKPGTPSWFKPRIVDETYTMRMAETAYHEVDGKVAIWKTKWDTK